ncbi:PITH domain-containing protein CG6153 isoform X1 [Phlebotomus papatasi]|uniref:PITH domain-containing protein CG6153 isoform X1 n=1 Tax=Phlebotomus papatasi TaxID=29031 RepID=UPI002483F074|nr:PITH domain-containing protein CG6153 isoform X1 [Phlebotomus papatasi]
MSHTHCCNHGSKNSENPNEIGINYSLYTKIDLDNVECLNESIENSGLHFCHRRHPAPIPLKMPYFLIFVRKFSRRNALFLTRLLPSGERRGKFIFRSYEERFDVDKYVESDADPELLFNIPFSGNVKLKSIIVMGADNNSHPNKLRLYKNRPKMTFDDVNLQPDQEFQLTIDSNGTVEYNTKPVVFSSVHHLSMHFPGNFGEDLTKIYYIGLRGEFSEAHHHGVTICNYEVRPNISDHKVSNTSLWRKSRS